MLIVSAAQMRRLDAWTIEHGTPGYTLMQRAGAGATRVLLQHFPAARRQRVLVVAGKGNNGGDGFIIARLLAAKGARCTVALLAPAAGITGDAARALAALRRAKVPLVEITDASGLEQLDALLARAAVIVDAIFGTGLNAPVDGLHAEIIARINAAVAPVLAVDIASGLDADRGIELGIAVRAAATASFAFPKLGQCIYPGAAYGGALEVVDIGISAEAIAAVGPRQHWLDAATAQPLLPTRQADSHKGTYGHVLMIAGSRGHSGAARIAARAAYRAGSGLVTLAGPHSLQTTFAAATPEVMTLGLADDDGHLAFDEATLRRAIAGKDAIVVGPGIGTHAAAQQTVEWLLREAAVPLLIDADAITCVARAADRLRAVRSAVILTPHPGEMARLAQVETADIQVDRIGHAQRFAETYGVHVILKGARSLIASPAAELWINASGNPGMASGGMGDALSGVVGSLLGQGMSPAAAACLGVYVHGDAGDAVAASRGPVGILASDVVDALPGAFGRLLALAGSGTQARR